jgi:hypothetical protein
VSEGNELKKSFFFIFDSALHYLHYPKFSSFVVALFFVSFFTSCEKAEAIIEVLSESDAAEIIEANLQDNAGGLVTNLEDLAEQFVSVVASGELCDTLYTETIDQ